MKGKGIDLKVWAWRAGPILLILAVRVFRQWQAGYLNRMWTGDLNLLIGWVLGWFLADADHLFYATMCNPQELTCQRVRQEAGKRNWRRMWGILEETKGERTKLPIRNILTAFVMTGVGWWMISSGASLLASGMCLGFSIRLFSEIVTDPDYGSWYWLFARPFSREEHRGLVIAWGSVLIWLFMMLVRG